MQDVVLITRDPLVLAEALEEIGHSANGSPGTDPEAGALVIFSGLVRATEGSETISHLDYEHYEGMAQREIERLLQRAREKWPIHRAAVLHRIGAVGVAESSVIVVVSAGHRAESFEAARFLIDELKKSVPIWKQAPDP